MASQSLDALLRSDGDAVFDLSNDPFDTTFDLGTWDGPTLVRAIRESKAAELPWWKLDAMNKFVAQVFRAVNSRKDETVLKLLPGFLAQLALSHDRLRSSFPSDVLLSTTTMWDHIRGHIQDETPHMSRYSNSIFKTMLPNALHTLDWAEKEHLRCVLQVIAIGITSDPSTSITLISKDDDKVGAIGKCLEVPDFQTQEAAIQILLCVVPFLSGDTLATVLPTHIHHFWSQLLAPPTTVTRELRQYVMEFNWNGTSRFSAVLSLRVHSSIVTTTGYSAACELDLAWLDVGLFSITCPNKQCRHYEMSSTPPLEILLSNVQSVNFPASAVEGMMSLEMNFTCGMLTNLLHGEEISLATSEKVHKLVVVLEVDNTERANLFQVRTTTVINHRHPDAHPWPQYTSSHLPEILTCH